MTADCGETSWYLVGFPLNSDINDTVSTLFLSNLFLFQHPNVVQMFMVATLFHPMLFCEEKWDASTYAANENCAFEETLICQTVIISEQI